MMITITEKQGAFFAPTSTEGLLQGRYTLYRSKELRSSQYTKARLYLAAGAKAFPVPS